MDVTLTDPLNRTIVLHTSTWYGHILKARPQLVACKTEVENAITDPEAIYHSTSAAECRIYYGFTNTSNLRMAVVADIINGYVKTTIAKDSLPFTYQSRYYQWICKNRI